MPVIEALLPIASSAANRKESSRLALNVPVEAPAPKEKKLLNQKLDSDPSPQEKKRKPPFSELLEERLQAREERNPEPTQIKDSGAGESESQDLPGNPLPLQGEPLPLSSTDEPALAAPSLVAEDTSPTSTPELQAATLLAVSDEAAMESPVQATASAEPAAAVETTAEPVPVQSAVTVEVTSREPVTEQIPAVQEAATPVVEEAAAPVQAEMLAAEAPASASASPEPDTADAPQAEVRADVPAQDTEAGNSQPVTAPLATAMRAADDAESPAPAEAAVQQTHADRVRAWRGLSLRPQGETANASARQDNHAVVASIAHSGQLQQFAQSLRQAVNQEVQPAAPGGERHSSSGPQLQSLADASAWRSEASPQQNTAVTVRAGLPTSTFNQALQGSLFGQPLGERFGSNAWGERLSQRISLMVGQKMSSASIQLDPPELGAMTVRLQMHADKASVSFQSPHAVVRDALEQSFPRLQEMLGQQGVQLVDAQVSDHSASGQGFADSGQERSHSGLPGEVDEGADVVVTRTVQVATGLIDYYA